MRRWWSQILKAQVQRGAAVYAEPEFGPAPYMHTMPHTDVPVADLWTVNGHETQNAIRVIVWLRQ